jgi:transcriptional regulator with GAF, ATPase, and Fis domain
MGGDAAELVSLRRERDLYRRLLELGHQTDLAPFLSDALALIVEVADARQGYLELHDDENAANPRWWIAHNLSAEEVSGVRAVISRGIIAETLASGRTTVTSSALVDPRFSGRESVRRAQIEAVFCAPIGDPPRGVLYLQGPTGSGLFGDETRGRVELFARHLAPLAERLLAEQWQSQADPPARRDAWRGGPNTDLERAVAERRFRDDLFYRLQVVPIRVPSLRERRGDIRELAAFFCAGASRRYGLERLDLTPGAIRALETAEWPGNVRQLAHAVEAAVIRAAGSGAARVEANHVFPRPAGSDVEGETGVTFQEATRRCQARLVRDTLEACGWNVVEAARRLDVARSHLYNLIRAFGIERKTD